MNITTKMIMAKKPCSEYTKEIVSGLIGKGKTLLEILSLKIPDDDIIWCVTKFLPDIENRKFAIWCARQCKTDIPEIKLYIDAIENYYIKKTISKEELDAADWATYRAAYRAASRAADWAASRAAYRAADWAASRAASRAAYWAADWAAYWAAYRAAHRAADWAASISAHRAACSMSIKKQITKLKEIVRGLK